jgi:Kef-type K+ transport system membrane component KefB
MLAMFLVFVSARLFRELMERLKQPGIVGEILAGILIGPYVLAWIHPNEILTTLSQLGVMFLLFRIGLEVKPSQLLRHGGTALTVAGSGVTLSCAVGVGISLAFGQSLMQALFVGTAVSATSVVITAEVLSSRGLLHARASQTILASAVVDDVLGLILLALVSNAARGQVNWFELAFTAVLATSFTLLVALWGHHAVRRVVPRMEASMRTAEAQFTIAMALLFGLSVLAVYAGVAAIIGAFLAGMALSETAGERVHTMTSGVSELLVPFFLAGIGMSLDPKVFQHRETIVLALVLLAGAILSKLVGCGLGAFRLGGVDALRVGAGMAPRGEVGMVVAQIGRQMGVMSDNVYAVVVFLSVATTLVAPPMIRFAFRGVTQHEREAQNLAGL